MKRGETGSDSGRRGTPIRDHQMSVCRELGMFPHIVTAVLDEFDSIYQAADFAATHDVAWGEEDDDRLLSIKHVGPSSRETLASLSLLPDGQRLSPDGVSHAIWTTVVDEEGTGYVLTHRDGTRVSVGEDESAGGWRVAVDRVDGEFSGTLGVWPESVAIEATKMVCRRYPLLTSPKRIEPNRTGWMPRDPENNEPEFFYGR